LIRSCQRGPSSWKVGEHLAVDPKCDQLPDARHDSALRDWGWRHRSSGLEQCLSISRADDVDCRFVGAFFARHGIDDRACRTRPSRVGAAVVLLQQQGRDVRVQQRGQPGRVRYWRSGRYERRGGRSRLPCWSRGRRLLPGRAWRRTCASQWSPPTATHSAASRRYCEPFPALRVFRRCVTSAILRTFPFARDCRAKADQRRPDWRDVPGLPRVDGRRMTLTFAVTGGFGTEAFRARLRYKAPGDTWPTEGPLPSAFLGRFGTGDLLTISDASGRKLGEFNLRGAEEVARQMRRVCRL